jgi:hypothetical protein
MHVPGIYKEQGRMGGGERERRGIPADPGMGPFSWLIGWVYLHVLAA